jgi:hypothetical protein
MVTRNRRAQPRPAPVTPSGAMGPQQGSTPNPDPTARTLESSRIDVNNLEKLVDVQLERLNEDTKSAAKGLVLVNAGDIEKERLVWLERLFDQKLLSNDLKIASVKELQKTEREDLKALFEEMIKGRDTALTAALRAQQELGSQLNISNNNVANIVQAYQKEALNQQQALFNTTSNAQAKEIAELRSRLDKGEGGTAGATGQRLEAREMQAAQLGAQGAQVSAGAVHTQQIALMVSIMVGVAGITIGVVSILIAAHI